MVWFMTNDPKLSSEARKVFLKADRGEDSIVIPCIAFFELLYLTEKSKLAIDFGGLIAMVSGSRNYRIEPLCLPIIEKCRKIRREEVADPWDRLIAATSMHLGFPLISGDQSLQEMGLEIVW